MVKFDEANCVMTFDGEVGYSWPKKLEGSAIRLMVASMKLLEPFLNSQDFVEYNQAVDLYSGRAVENANYSYTTPLLVNYSCGTSSLGENVPNLNTLQEGLNLVYRFSGEDVVLTDDALAYNLRWLHKAAMTVSTRAEFMELLEDIRNTSLCTSGFSKCQHYLLARKVYDNLTPEQQTEVIELNLPEEVADATPSTL